MRRYRACWVRTAVPSACLHLSLLAQYFLLFWKSHMLCDHVLAERIPRCIRNMTIYQLRSDNVRSFFIIRFEGCKIANILKTCNLATFVSLGSEMLADCTILRSFSRFLTRHSNIANTLPVATFPSCKNKLRNKAFWLLLTTVFVENCTAIQNLKSVFRYSTVLG